MNVPELAQTSVPQTPTTSPCGVEVEAQELKQETVLFVDAVRLCTALENIPETSPIAPKIYTLQDSKGSQSFVSEDDVYVERIKRFDSFSRKMKPVPNKFKPILEAQEKVAEPQDYD